MSRFAANCKISGPVAVKATPHVDFNGLLWNYTIGLMFPATAETQRVPVQLPNSTNLYTPGTVR